MSKSALPAAYEYVSDLGSGAFGEVVAARQVMLDRLVAIKTMHSFVLADNDAVDRFRREAQVLATLRHPAIVKVFDFTTTPNGAVLVMEYVRGNTLSALLRRGALPASAGLVILRDVASALAVAAGAGVAHRDVKPANVFVLPDGHAKLGDFGLARIIADPAVFRTTDGRPSGTPAYFPPEVSMGLAEPDERADAYSFAVMAYEVLTGRQPFLADGAAATIAAHWHRQAAPPDQVVHGFPARASAAILAGLDKLPERRTLPVELVDELTRVPPAEWPASPLAIDHSAGESADRPASNSSTTRAAIPLPPMASSLADADAGAAATAHRRRNRTPWLLALAVLVVLVVGVVVFAVTRPGDGPGARPPLAVTSISVTATPDPLRGRCPTTEFDFIAVITTNGGRGTIDLRWTRPDGQVTGIQHVEASAGQAKVQAGLRFVVSGARPLHGAAVVHVLAPRALDRASKTIDYRC